MLTNIKYIVCTLWSIEEFALTSLMIRLDGFLCLPWHFFAQAPQGHERFAFAQAARAFHFFCPNKRNETKKIRRLHFLDYSGTFLR